MTKGCKIWLWILMVGAGFSIIGGFTSISYSAGSGIFAIIMGLVQLAGISLLLFQQKKEGFYLICAACLITFIFNITHQTNFVLALIGAVASPAITYFFIHKGLSGNPVLTTAEMDTNPVQTETASSTGNYTNFANNNTASTENQTNFTNNTTASTDSQTTFNNSTTDSTDSQTNFTNNQTTSAFNSSQADSANTYTAFDNTNTYNTASNNTTTNTTNNFTSQSKEADSSSKKTTNTKNNTSKNSTFENKTPIFGSAKNMNITVDLYKELEIDRAWDERSIRNHLKNLQKLWTQRQGATNDKEQLLLIDKILKFIEDGYRFLTKELKRQQYDKALELAYKAGKIVDEAAEQLNTLLEQAKAYYRKGNIKMAAQCAQEAIDGKVNDASAYDLLAHCYYDATAYQNALNIIDQGLSIFKTDFNLHWLGARIATNGLKDFNNAQQRINTLIELDPNNPIGHSEQVYMHLRRGDEQLAFQEIDSYIVSHPEDNVFKRRVAYDLDTYSNSCFYYDAAQNASFIADKTSYNKCLTLRSKAAEIFSDEHTQNQLEGAKFYGQKEWNDWNLPAIKSLAIYGTIFTALGIASSDFLVFGIALYAVMALLIYFSFRPYWQINKTYVTGQMGTLELVVNKVGDLSAKFAAAFLKFMLKFFELIIKFIMGCAKWL